MPGIAFKVGFVDQKNRLRGLQKAIGFALAGGLNDGGRRVFTVLRKQLQRQTRPKNYRTITSRTWDTKANPGYLSYVIWAKDEPIDIIEFGAEATGAGIEAAPWGVSRVFARSFHKGGRSLAKSTSNSGGFFARIGAKHYPIRPLHGPNLAKEMMGLTPGSEVPQYFDTFARIYVPPAIVARLTKAMG